MTDKVSRASGIAVLIGLTLCLTVRLTADERGAGRGPAGPEPSLLADGEFTIKPPFANSPDLIFNNNVPHGTVHRFTMNSQDSKIYRGISRTQPGAVVPYERPVAVYVPAQYVPGTAAPFIVVQDGYNPTSFGNWILANQHTAAVLRAKGYAYRYLYAEGARHTDANVIYQTLPQALEYLWQGYPIQ